VELTYFYPITLTGWLFHRCSATVFFHLLYVQELEYDTRSPATAP